MWKLVPPRPPKTRFYYVRGEYLGIRLDHSTGTGEASAARRIIATWRKQAERGEFRHGNGQDRGPLTFAGAAAAYMRAGGDGQYLEQVLRAWPDRIVTDIDQIALDTLAAELYPTATAATRNRQVYTPVAAVMHRAGIEKRFKRPPGWQGKKSTSWLELEQAAMLFAAADDVDVEFGLLCRFLLYTGMRLGEALGVKLRDLKLDRSFVYLPDSKNGEPRGCHLPPNLVLAMKAQPPRRMTTVVRDNSGHFLSGKPLADEGVPFLDRHPESKLFRFHNGGALRSMLKSAMKAAGLFFPRRQGGFHIFCHTYGSWMHRFAGLDRHGLTRTGRWADPDSADRYVHTAQSEEACRSNLLPWPERGADVEKTKRAG